MGSFGRCLLRARTIAIVLLLIMPHAVAAPPPLLGLTWPGLTREDIERMGAASEKVLQQASDNAAAVWQNPESHHAGVVRVVRTSEEHGMPCRLLDYTIRFEELVKSPDHYVVNWCRLPDGEWKIVELAQ